MVIEGLLDASACLLDKLQLSEVRTFWSSTIKEVGIRGMVYFLFRTVFSREPPEWLNETGVNIPSSGASSLGGVVTSSTHQPLPHSLSKAVLVEKKCTSVDVEGHWVRPLDMSGST